MTRPASRPVAALVAAFFVELLLVASLSLSTPVAAFVVVPSAPAAAAPRQHSTSFQHRLQRPGRLMVPVMAAAGTGGSSPKPPVQNLKQIKYDYNTIINQVCVCAACPVCTSPMEVGLKSAEGIWALIMVDRHTLLHTRTQAAKAASDAIKTGGMRLITIDYPANEGKQGRYIGQKMTWRT